MTLDDTNKNKTAASNDISLQRKLHGTTKAIPTATLTITTKMTLTLIPTATLTLIPTNLNVLLQGTPDLSRLIFSYHQGTTFKILITVTLTLALQTSDAV